MQSPAPDSRRIDQLGDFLVRRVIGEGGMGIVYDASERLSGRRVALKVLHSSLTRSPEARARFATEMRIMAGLEHPHIVRSLSSAEIEGKLVLVLEYLEGRTLRQELAERGALSITRTLAIARAVSSALVAAHGRQPPIVHRDLKPENLMLLEDGGVKVMDFGVAKILSEAHGQTSATQVVGTAQYMSPEQAEGRPITPQTDLYALGLVIYEMLTGSAPFESPSLMGILRHQCETQPPPLPEALRREVPTELGALLFQLLEKAPERRPADASVVLRVLQASLAPVSATSATLQVRTPAPVAGPPPVVRPMRAFVTGGPNKLDTIELLDRFEKKRRWPWIAGAGAVGVAAAIAVPLLLGVGDAPRSSKPRKAATQSAVAATAPAATPAPTAPASALVADRCAGRDICTPFIAPDMSRVEAELVIDAGARFATQIEPSAKLENISVARTIAGGLLDLTQPKAQVLLTFGTVSGLLSLRLSDRHFTGMKISPAASGTPLPAHACSFKRVFEAATAAGFPFNADSRAQLTPPLLGHFEWMLSTDTQHARVDANTCAATFKRR